MRSYNFVYRRLVPKDSNDLVGLLAYTVYKNQKIEFIENYKAENNGVDPPEDELSRFHQFSSSDSQVNQYLTSAEKELEKFLNLVLEQKSAEIEGFYRDIAKKSGRGFWYGVWQGTVGSLLYTLILGLIVFLAWSSQIGPRQVYERLNNVKIVPDTNKVYNK